MRDILFWIVFLYPLIGLGLFWPLACYRDKEMPGLVDTVKITFLWPVALFVMSILWLDGYETRRQRRR